ncbi:hypothetical protein B0H12DRAFT_1106922 [Mycena haematopus]|nr:hypothetical protein B0H12DRAFT_1106922 [Mycena haematopus]
MDSSATATPSVAESFASRFRHSSANMSGSLGIHHGALDPGTITTGQPPEVMRHVREVLVEMGVKIFVKSEYNYRCVRAKQRRKGKSTIGSSSGAGALGGVAAFTVASSAGLEKAVKRGLPLPSQSSFSGGGMLRGLLMRQQSSQVSTAPGSNDADHSLNTSEILTSEPTGQADTVYGTSVEDACDEVRFSVELTRVNLLNDTYSLDIRRLKGNLRSYKFLYDTLRKRADL